MKTQKKLPELFYIQENEKTNEYCEMLGISRDGLTTEDNYGDYLFFNNKKCADAYCYDDLDVLKQNYPNAVFVDLSDYLDQEQPEPKWQEKTIGGYNCVVFEEFNNQLFGGVEYNGKWYGATWDLDGNFNCFKLNDTWDLLPINNELTTLEKELEEVRSKEKQILEKIKELKK